METQRSREYNDQIKKTLVKQQKKVDQIVQLWKSSGAV